MSLVAATIQRMTADANGYPHSGFPSECARQWQEVLNQDWPCRDRNGPHAREGIIYVTSVPVTARIIWEHDGEERIDGQVTRWNETMTHVFVEADDGRLQINGVWLRVEDTRKR